MSSPINWTSVQTNATAESANGKSAPPTSRNDVSKETFLQLLVAQIKNQDPLNPADGVQFLTQLAQFSQLEQSLAMRTSLEEIASTLRNPS